MPEKPSYEPARTASDDSVLDEVLQAREGTAATEVAIGAEAAKLRSILPKASASSADALALALRDSGGFDSFVAVISDPVR